ncbi:hypothetical protein FOL47_007042 [Perkinsus chesapeaki]|uniref:Uncharacterized protein n=1 Tax=Perkinsus chesapeaki TaxID=330153 RepID=A0A7J6LNF6_PERCH|nr:hypothetical protein FOL47_007042 [Perkinsus chesapeaki]
MKLSSIFLVISASISTSVALVPGRYLYEDEDGKYRLAFDFYEDERITVIFDTPTNHFLDGRFSLTHQSVGTYAIDFNGAFEGATSLYNGIQSIYPGVSFHDGDLTTVTFTSYGSPLYVTFEGQSLELLPYGFPMVEGTFVNSDDPYLRINYTFQAEARLDVQVVCGENKTSTVSFNLTESSRKFYDLSPPEKILELEGELDRACPWLLMELNDLTNVRFASPSLAFIVLEGIMTPLRQI